MAIRGQTSEQPRSNPIQTHLDNSRETQWYGARREAKQCRSQTQIARGEIRAEKEALQDPELPSEMREKNRYKLSKLPRNSAFTRIRNRCVCSLVGLGP
ncbi:unnamed protein product [Brassica oleracea var. botrytis]